MDSSSSTPWSAHDGTGGEMGKAVTWFQSSSTNDKENSPINPLDEATIVQDHMRFRHKFRWVSRQKSIKKDISSTKEALEKQIKSVENDFDNVKAQAHGLVDKANESHVVYQNARATGRRRFGQQAQRFVTCFGEFLSAYSGIVDMLSSAGGIYSTIAYETLSIFLCVVVNKTGNDSKIADLLSTLRKSFPQLDEWTNLYPSQSMKAAVFDVYKGVIEFARSTTKYFSRRFTRVWMAIGRPPPIGIDKITVAIQGKLAEVNFEAGRQLHKRSRDIQTTGDDSNARIKTLESLNGALVRSLERLEAQYKKLDLEFKLKEEQENLQRMLRFKEALKITYPCPETNLEDCRHKLQQAFVATATPRQARRILYIPMTTKLLSLIPAYQQWQNCTESCVLFLSGSTKPESRCDTGRTHSWLSPATTIIAEEKILRGERVAFYSCHPDIRGETHHGVTVFSTLIYQILGWSPGVLRGKREEYKSLIESEAWRGLDGSDQWDKEKATMKVVFQLLRDVLSEVQDAGFVYLVIDRIDLCDWKTPRLMEQLTQVVLEASCKVKVVAVGRDDWDIEDTPEKYVGRVMAHQAWNQRQLSRLEMQKATSSRSINGA